MSRTYKDRPHKVVYKELELSWDIDTKRISYMREYIPYGTTEPTTYESWYYISTPTTKTKKRKEVDTGHHWMSTPSWWTHLRMTKPQRRSGTLWEREVVKTQLTELEEVDKPSVSRNPHIYFW